jgi:hypothetical protein
MCYVVASQGLGERADKLIAHGADRSKTILVGKGHPDLGNFHGSMQVGEFLDSSVRDGLFSDRIAKSFLTAMYAEWDESYRHKVAQEVGVMQNAVQSDLMGDMRLIRHCIVHSKSVVTNEHQRLKELKWELAPGDLRITSEMFSRLVNQINRMQVLIASQ